MTHLEFDKEKFAEAVRSLYFERTREKAQEIEEILIAQVEAIVTIGLRKEHALREVTEGREMVRLAKLLTGEENPNPVTVLKDAADRIEVMESRIEELTAPKAAEAEVGVGLTE